MYPLKLLFKNDPITICDNAVPCWTLSNKDAELPKVHHHLAAARLSFHHNKTAFLLGHCAANAFRLSVTIFHRKSPIVLHTQTFPFINERDKLIRTQLTIRPHNAQTQTTKTNIEQTTCGSCELLLALT